MKAIMQLENELIVIIKSSSLSLPFIYVSKWNNLVRIFIENTSLQP